MLTKDQEKWINSLASKMNKIKIVPLRRARFVKYIDGIKIEMFIINEKSFDWINSLKFEDYLKSRAEALEAYKKLKEDCEGLSVSEYYRRKTEFINDILAKC